MSKERTSDGPAPKVYDTEKIIDIHSPEWDPSLDSQKVREVKSYIPQLKYTHSSGYTGTKNDDNPTSTEAIPTLAKFSHTDKNKDVDVYDYRGKLK